MFVPATQEELREARRQQRKLNFLITQTELYSHFLAKKLGASGDAEAPAPASATVAAAAAAAAAAPTAAPVDMASLDFDATDDATLRAAAAHQAMQGAWAWAHRCLGTPPTTHLFHVSPTPAAVGVLESKTRAFDEAASVRRQDAKASAAAYAAAGGNAAPPNLEAAGLDLTGALNAARASRRAVVGSDTH